MKVESGKHNLCKGRNLCWFSYTFFQILSLVMSSLTSQVSKSISGKMCFLYWMLWCPPQVPELSPYPPRCWERLQRSWFSLRLALSWTESLCPRSSHLPGAPPDQRPVQGNAERLSQSRAPCTDQLIPLLQGPPSQISLPILFPSFFNRYWTWYESSKLSAQKSPSQSLLSRNPNPKAT